MWIGTTNGDVDCRPSYFEAFNTAQANYFVFDSLAWAINEYADCRPSYFEVFNTAHIERLALLERTFDVFVEE